MTRPARSSTRVALALLAAGASRRMGAPKLLMPFGETTLLQRALSAAQGSGADAICVITGAYHDAMLETLKEARATIIHNELWEQGRASSVCAAAHYCKREGFGALLLMVADQPFVKAAHLATLIDAYHAYPADIFVTEVAGRRGNPCLVDARCFDALSALSGDEGVRQLFSEAGSPFAIQSVPCADARVFEDVDTASDLQRLEGELDYGR